MMYGNYGFMDTGGESNESILQRGPPCETSPGILDKARWGLHEAKDSWFMLALGTAFIVPYAVAPWVGKAFMKDASFRKRLLVTNAAIVLAFAATQFRSGEREWKNACESQRRVAAYRQTDRYKKNALRDELVQRYEAQGYSFAEARQRAFDDVYKGGR
tara:strand:- start:171 stop:647 length:477 start_codon:yes stop_codon:yes gene_type:complete